ncbi:hypothetical protein IX46_00390 [Buchnera aphidicola (Aphis glycines)]|uniref:Flagellar assembly protein FliH n=1 Tax=Buchnera aphidicola (Aphis glycines) TaxID=1265350 RepID=A0A0M3RS86_9GAMM|nr:FliH/SctL family protein [Buchnera aphidicola]ALD15040.1 hypothetical protein IX46_00390 [Buchnera aphidicola (Aphis glycines)]
MSDSDLKKEWKKWHPKKIFLNNSEKKHNVFWNTSALKETDFSTEKKDELNHKFKNSNRLQKESCHDNKLSFLNIQRQLEEKEKKYALLNNKLRNLCSSFESTMSFFEKTLSSRLLKTILMVASYIVGEKFSINESVLLERVKKIVDNDNFFLKQPKLVVHPGNKQILEKILKQPIHSKWELVFDKSIDINSFKILSEQSNIDGTIHARWKEIYRIILEKEKEN